ncbi:unnamed protein product, partial [Rotaria sp. Silwood1]
MTIFDFSLLATLTHGFPQFPTSPMSSQQPAIVKP